ncbi:MAG: hypothetical protein AAF998_17890 [Bacteroidota bacterium]
MPAAKTTKLNSRKPFKLLAQLDDEGLESILEALQLRVKRHPNRLNQKLLTYFDRILALGAVHQPISREAFIAGTDLPASENAFDKLTSHFYNFLQEFFAQRELERDPIALQQLAFRAYRDLSLDWPEVKRRHGEAQRVLDKFPQSSQLSNARLVLDLDLAKQASNRFVPADERDYDGLLDALEANYVIQKLRLLCAIANERRIFKAPTPDMAIAETVPRWRDSWPPLAQMYYRLYELLSGEVEVAATAQLQQLLDAQDVTVLTYPREDMLDLYGYLLNALTRKLNQGDRDALYALSRLHDHLIEKGILLDEGYILAEHFKNVISVKLKAGEVQEARQHYDTLAGKIANDPDRNAARYNHALLLYAENKLVEAARELEELCSQTGNLKLDLFYGLDMRSNLLKVYYDLLAAAEDNPVLWDQTDEKMERLLESYRGYIERRKLPEHRRASYDSFRDLIQELYYFSYRRDLFKAADSMAALRAVITELGQGADPWFEVRLDRMQS